MDHSATAGANAGAYGVVVQSGIRVHGGGADRSRRKSESRGTNAISIETGSSSRKRAAASEGRAAAAEERAAAADKRAAAADQAAKKLDQSLDEIKGWLHTAYHAYHAIQTNASSIESRVSALDGGHKEHQDAQSSDRQLLQEQLQVLIDEQRKLHAELTQIQQHKKPTITSNTSKSVKHTSSCSSSSEQGLAQKVMRSTSVS